MTERARSYVYCIQEQCRDAFAPIKIGIAVEPQTRLDALQVGNPMTLAIYGLIGPFKRQQAVRMESDLHVAMSRHRIRGEWFSGRALPYFEEAQGVHAEKVRLQNIEDFIAGKGNGQPESGKCEISTGQAGNVVSMA